MISAVAGELFPLMSQEGTSGFGLFAGFVLGLLCMFGLEQLTQGSEESEEDSRKSRGESDFMATPMLPSENQRIMVSFKQKVDMLNQGITQLDAGVKDAAKDGSRETIDETLHSLMYQTDRARRQLKTEPLDEKNLRRMGDHIQELRENYAAILNTGTTGAAVKALDAFENTLGHLHDHSDRTRFRRFKPEHHQGKPAVESIPWPLVFTVSVDAAVDGFLIGLAFSAAESAGWCMSIATSIEMGFLGLSFMATLRNSMRSRLKLVSLGALPPVTLLACGFLGQVLGQELKAESFLFTSFIAFAVVALLFLVTQELLAEAREVAGDDTLVNSTLFLGLFAGILLERWLG